MAARVSAGGWPEPSPVAGQVLLDFGGDLGERKTLKNFSAGSRVGASLFLAADEFGCIDRLTETADGRWANHERFSLADLLDLDNADGEADLEGLAADADWFYKALPIVVSAVVAFLEALIIGLTPDEKFDAAFNAESGRKSNSSWVLAVLLVATMMIGTTTLIATMARLFDLLYTGGAYG